MSRLGVRVDDFTVRQPLTTIKDPRIFRPVDDLQKLSTASAGTEATFTRAEVGMPVCPTAVPSDTVLYEHATDAATKYYLPRYRLRQASGRYEIGIAEDAGAWKVTLGLERFPAEEVREASRTAQPLPHARQVVISYGPDVLRQFVASAVADDQAGTTVTFRLTLEERDGLLRAFQSDGAQATLLVTRGIEVAVPVPADGGPPRIFTLTKHNLVLINPDLVKLRGTVISSDPLPKHEVPPKFVTGPVPKDLATRVLARRATLQPELIAHDLAPGMAVGLARPLKPHLQLNRPVALRPRDDIDVIDHGGDEPFPKPRPKPFPLPKPKPDPPPPPPPPPEPRFAKRSLSLPSPIALRFDPVTHPYVFDVGLGGTGGAEYERILVPFPATGPTAVQHAYLQDRLRPNVFHYLPDEFLLARTDQVTYVPALAFQVGGTEQTSTVQLNSKLRPSTNSQRLIDALPALAARVPQRAGLDPTPVLQPLVASSTVRLQLPGGARELDDQVDLANGFWVSEELALPDFRQFWGLLAASANGPTALRGTVTVHTGLSADDLVQIRLSLRHMVGEIFGYTETWDETAASMSVTITNATESPQRIEKLPGWLRRGTAVVPAQLGGLDLSAPVVLAPEQSVTFSLTSAVPLPGEGAVDAIVDLGAVTSVIDPEIILGLALDETVLLDAVTEVTVVTTKASLGNAGKPEGPITKIGIECRNGPSVVVDTDHLEVVVDVPLSLAAVLLPDEGGDTFQVRQTLFYESGEIKQTGWTRRDGTLLPLPLLPAAP